MTNAASGDQTLFPYLLKHTAMPNSIHCSRQPEVQLYDSSCQDQHDGVAGFLHPCPYMCLQLWALLGLMMDDTCKILGLQQLYRTPPVASAICCDPLLIL